MITSIANGIPNLFCVDQAQNIWRGGQPSDAGWRWLCGQGIEAVVKLNTENEGSDFDAKALGMTIARIPMPWWRQVIYRPAQDDLVEAVKVIVQNSFIHCEHGQDRTGIVVACYRLSQGWSKDDAWLEMIAHGFHESLGGLWRAWQAQRPEDWR
jgi:protein tyrosine/serine phosphatase